MNHWEKAGELFLSGYNCAQSVAVAFCDVTGLEESTAAKLASPFGGGMGRMREVCGAFSGAMQVLGCLYGYDTPGDDAHKKVLYQQVQSLAARFRAEVGSLICREILKNPSTDPTPTIRTPKFYETRPCVRMVMTAARLLEEFMEENPL